MGYTIILPKIVFSDFDNTYIKNNYLFKFEFRLKDLYESNASPELNSDLSFKKLKRRYKEFVQLQKSLEDNSHFKHFLKSIKTPAKYVLPIGNMEIEYVEKRRKRLNDYLNVNT